MAAAIPCPPGASASGDECNGELVGKALRRWRLFSQMLHTRARSSSSSSPSDKPSVAAAAILVSGAGRLDVPCADFRGANFFLCLSRASRANCFQPSVWHMQQIDAFQEGTKNCCHRKLTEIKRIKSSLNIALVSRDYLIWCAQNCSYLAHGWMHHVHRIGYRQPFDQDSPVAQLLSILLSIHISAT